MNRRARAALALVMFVLGGTGYFVLSQVPRPLRTQSLSSTALLEGSRANWAVDPLDGGNSTPPAGTQSLFDDLYKDSQGHYHLPGNGSFEDLQTDLKKRISDDGQRLSGLPGVLIPLGRSLQRASAISKDHRPLFFEFPRAVISLDREIPERGDAGFSPTTKDRLFLGYMEFNRQMEIISYNELAGRFEFQKATQVGPGLKPHIEYEDRNFCLSCHQNQAPLFPVRQTQTQDWEETHTAPAINARLFSTPLFVSKLKNSKYLGISIHESHDVDAPSALNSSSDRANLFAVHQLLWTKLCRSDDCRAELLTSLLEYGLTQSSLVLSRSDVNDHVRSEIKENIPAAWSAGLNIPNSNLPNRNPLASLEAQCDLAVASRIYDVASLIGKENADALAKFDPHNPIDRLAMAPLLEKANQQFVLPAHLDAARKAELDQLEADTKGLTRVNPLCNPRRLRLPSSGQGNSQAKFYLAQTQDQNKMIEGLASFFTESDLNRVDAELQALATPLQALVHPTCRSSPVNAAGDILIECLEGSTLQAQAFRLRASVHVQNNKVERAQVSDIIVLDRKDCHTAYSDYYDDESCAHLNQTSDVRGVIENGVIKLITLNNDKHRRARLSNGWVIGEVDIPLKSEGAVILMLEDERPKLRAAATKAIGLLRQQSPALMDLAMSRRLILPAFSSAVTGRAFSDPAANITSILEVRHVTQNVPPLFQSCALCHVRTDDPTMPDFLYTEEVGPAGEKAINRQINLCAARMYFRLRQDHEVGMPPLSFFAQTHQSLDQFSSQRSAIEENLKTRLQKIYGPDPKLWVRSDGDCSQALAKFRGHP